MKITFLGTGSAVPTATRQNLSILLESENKIVLVDCGNSPAQNILKNGYQLEILTDVILTHIHTDHIYALPSLIHSLWLHGGIKSGKEIRIHAPGDVIEIGKNLIELFDLSNKRDAVDIMWNELSPSVSHSINSSLKQHDLAYFSVTHGNIPTIGISIRNSSGKKLIYSSDSIIDQNIKNQLDDNVKILVQDCGSKMNGTKAHAGANDINGLIVNYENLKQVYLVHFPHLSQDEELSIKQVAKKGFEGEIFLPEDNDFFEFN